MLKGNINDDNLESFHERFSVETFSRMFEYWRINLRELFTFYFYIGLRPKQKPTDQVQNNASEIIAPSERQIERLYRPTKGDPEKHLSLLNQFACLNPDMPSTRFLTLLFRNQDLKR